MAQPLEKMVHTPMHTAECGRYTGWGNAAAAAAICNLFARLSLLIRDAVV